MFVALKFSPMASEKVNRSGRLQWWQVPYTFWAIGCFMLLVLPLGSLGYALFSLSPARGRERRMFYTNNFLAVLWGGLTGIRYRVVDGHWQHSVDAFVLAPTHTATPDMMVVSYALRRGTRFLVKAELRKVPMLGFMFARMGVFVDRKNAESRKSARTRLRALAREGVSVCIFPEGTRNTTDAPLAPFYDGAFATAIDAGIPVLPMVLFGGPEVMPNGQWWMRPGTLVARFLPPVSGQTLSQMDSGTEEPQLPLPPSIEPPSVEPPADATADAVQGLKQLVRQRMLAAIAAGPEGQGPAGSV